MAQTQWVYGFGGGERAGDASMKALLGGKGANLAEMAQARSAGAARLHASPPKSAPRFTRTIATYPA